MVFHVYPPQILIGHRPTGYGFTRPCNSKFLKSSRLAVIRWLPFISLVAPMSSTVSGASRYRTYFSYRDQQSANSSKLSSDALCFGFPFQNSFSTSRCQCLFSTPEVASFCSSLSSSFLLNVKTPLTKLVASISKAWLIFGKSSSVMCISM